MKVPAGRAGENQVKISGVRGSRDDKRMEEDCMSLWKSRDSGLHGGHVVLEQATGEVLVQ